MKRKEPQELVEGGELKRAPPDEDDEGMSLMIWFRAGLMTLQ